MNHYLIFGLGLFIGVFAGICVVGIFSCSRDEVWIEKNEEYDTAAGHETARDMLMRGEI